MKVTRLNRNEQGSSAGPAANLEKVRREEKIGGVKKVDVLVSEWDGRRL